MSDIHTPAQRHRNMAAIHSANTKPELILRKELWRLGFRYRTNDKTLPGKPDIVFPKYRTVIFVHGCFWHGHNGCKKNVIPKSNTDFWNTKISRNKERDQEKLRQLEAKGWFVIVVWECELEKNQIHDTINNVSVIIHRNGDILKAEKEERSKAREEYLLAQKNKKSREAAMKTELREIFPK